MPVAAVKYKGLGGNHEHLATTSPKHRGNYSPGLLAAGAALPLFGILSHRASAAEFDYKLATGQDPTHPVNMRAQEALNRIREATGGRVDIKLFPANQLGSDTDLLLRCATAASNSSICRPPFCHLRARCRHLEYRLCL